MSIFLSTLQDNTIFYIGKGSGDRFFTHAKGSVKETASSVLSPKIELIKEIMAAGEDVEYRMVRWNLEEDKAFEIESILIASYQKATQIPSNICLSNKLKFLYK